MKILSISNCPLNDLQGSGKAILRYTEGLKAQGHDVDLLGPCDFEPLPGLARVRAYKQSFGIWRKMRQMRMADYDLIELYGAELWPVAVTMFRDRNRPVIVAHTNGFEPHAMAILGKGNAFKQRASLTLQSRLWKLYYKNVDYLVCISLADRNFAEANRYLPASRIAIVEHGIDSEFFQSSQLSRHERIAFVGSWIAVKGISCITETMNAILTKYTEYTFHIYGAGLPKETVLASFSEPIRHRVFCKGTLPKDQLAEELSLAKIFFFPTRYEGFGLALAEAMASGCAAVTTEAGFGSNLIDGVNALICKADDPHAMVNAIRRLIEDQDFCERIAAAGKARVRPLTWQRASKELSELYSNWSSQQFSKLKVRVSGL